MPVAKPSALTLDQRIAIETAPGWRPNATEDHTIEKATVVGLRMHFDPANPDYGKSPVIVYRKQDGTYIAVYAFHTVLRERLAELKTDIGSVQTLKYLGSHTSNTRTDANGDPQRYESYYVENDGTDIKAVSDDFTFAPKAK
jgi:hypothetical protein